MYPFVEIKNVSKKIDQFLLGPVQLTIEPGTVTALVGDNGSGKSTLIKMIMNLVNPTEGTIEAFSHDVHSNDEVWKEYIAYQAQTTIGYDTFTGIDLKQFISHWYPNWDEALFRKIVNDLDIPLNKRFSKLSQGVQQKLVLALTISRGAKLLILDEPMTFLDIPSKQYVTNLLVDWMEADENNRSIILASHHADDIEKLADYIYLLRRGMTIGLFEKDSLVDRYKRFWISDMKRLLSDSVPGEVDREANNILSNNMEETEQFLQQHHIEVERITSLTLEEIIAFELMNESK